MLTLSFAEMDGLQTCPTPLIIAVYGEGSLPPLAGTKYCVLLRNSSSYPVVSFNGTDVRGFSDELMLALDR